MKSYRIGRQRGIRFDLHPGPWISLGVHAHVWPPAEAHVDLHLPWVVVMFGRHW